MMDDIAEQTTTDPRPDLHRGEARAGNVIRFLLIAVGFAALWYTNGGHLSRTALTGWAVYGSLSVILIIIFRLPSLPPRSVVPLAYIAYVSDLVYVAFLVSATGGLTSDVYILYTPLALKAAVYYPILPPILLISYLIAPLYAIGLRLSAGSWYFLLDRSFLPRYVLLFSIMFTAVYMAWLFERRHIHINQLTERLNAKARVLEETATGLGDRLIELRTLQEGIKAINSALALEELLHLIAVNASQVLGVAQCLVSLLDEGTGDVVPRAASGMPAHVLRDVRLKPGMGIEGFVIQTGKAVLIGDVRGDPRFVQIGDYPVISVMAVPLMSDNRPVGVLMATSRKRNAFQDEDLNLLAAFADQAAIAVKNAALYQRLEEEKKRTEAIIQGLGDGVIVTDAHLNLVLLNPMAAQIFGLSGPPAPGVPVTELFGNVGIVDFLTKALVDGGEPITGEIALPGPKADRKRVYHVLTTTVRDEANTVRNIVAVLRDITSRKEVEEMKSNFLSVVSHELKTPLHSIKGFVDIILMGKTGRITETQRDFLTIVKTQTTSLQNQINDLLEFSRLEAGQVRLRIEDVAMSEIASSVIEKLKPQAQEGQVSLESRLPADFPSIQADRGRLEQVITNLVDNAIKFTPAGGRVTISGEDQGPIVQVSVSDTGIGIPPEAQKQVFDRFYQVDGSPTRSYRGTGLGLTICKHIVEQHHGRIWVESEEGKGSTFHFQIPKQFSTGGDEAALDFAAFPSSLNKS